MKDLQLITNPQKIRMRLRLLVFIILIIYLLCIPITSAYTDDIIVSGYVNYIDQDKSHTESPVRHAKVILYDFDDPIENHLGISTTDENGYYQFDPVNNDDSDGTGLDLFVEILATNPFVDVTDEDLNIYTFKTNTTWNVPMKNITINTTATDSHGAYHILSMISIASAFVEDQSGNATPKVTIMWHSGYMNGSYYSPSSHLIGLQYTDAFDEDSLLHEYGHHIQNTYAEIPPFDYGDDKTHSWDSEETVETAWAEGFPYFFAVAISS